MPIISTMMLLASLLPQHTSYPVNINDDHSSEVYLSIVDSAQYYIDNKRWDKAEKHLLDAIKLRPADSGNVMLWSNLGVVRTHIGDYPGAIEAYDAALARAPRSVVLLSNKGSALISAGQYEQAKEILSEAIGIDSLLKRPRLFRAMLEMRDNNTEKAEEDYRFIIQNDSICDQAYAGLSQCKLQEGNLTEAEILIDRALQISEQEEYYCLATLIKSEMEKLSEARQTVMEGIRKYPDSGNLYLHLSYINRLSHLNNEAESAYKTAVRLGFDEGIATKLRLNQLKK